MFFVFFTSFLLVLSDLGMGIIMRDARPLPTNDTSWQCLEPKHANENLLEIGENIFSCAKRNLYVNLINNVDTDVMDVGDGVTFFRESDDQLSNREIYPLEEPATFRGLLNAYSDFLSRRGARWDLGFVYPGLVMRIGPTMSGSGVLEFGIEKRLDYIDRANLGPGQMIIRQTILPRLLGFRMNLSSLLPLIIGVILIVTKNAFVFSKVTLVLSVLLTLKSLVLLQLFRPTENISHNQVHRPPISVPHDSVNFDDPITITSANRPRPQGYSLSESLSDSFLSEVVKKLPSYTSTNEDLSRRRSKTGKRNFSWGKK